VSVGGGIRRRRKQKKQTVQRNAGASKSRGLSKHAKKCSHTWEFREGIFRNIFVESKTHPTTQTATTKGTRIGAKNMYRKEKTVSRLQQGTVDFNTLTARTEVTSLGEGGPLS